MTTSTLVRLTPLKKDFTLLLESTTSGQAHKVLKGNYFNHFKANLGEYNHAHLLIDKC